MKLALFESFTGDKGAMMFSRIVYVAKVYKGSISIAYSQNDIMQHVVDGFRVGRVSGVCRSVGHVVKKELRLVDDECARLEEFRLLRNKLMSCLTNVEILLRMTEITTMPKLVDLKEMTEVIEIIDLLVKKLGAGTEPKS